MNLRVKKSKGPLCFNAATFADGDDRERFQEPSPLLLTHLDIRRNYRFVHQARLSQFPLKIKAFLANVRQRNKATLGPQQRSATASQCVENNVAEPSLD